MTQLRGLGRTVQVGSIGGINASGVVAGAIVDSAGDHAVLWKNRTVKELPRLSGSTGADANGINDRGDVIGVSIGGGPRTPVLWPKGRAPVRLSTLVPTGVTATFYAAYGISAGGQITGQADLGLGRVGYVLTP